MFREIYLHLKKMNFDVYSIGQHEGYCEKPYIVIRELGQSEITSKSLMNDNIEILLYYPFARYSEFGGYIQEVKKAMKKLNYRRVINPNPIVIDNDKKAYMTFISYKKIKIKEV